MYFNLMCNIMYAQVDRKTYSRHNNNELLIDNPVTLNKVINT